MIYYPSKNLHASINFN